MSVLGLTKRLGHAVANVTSHVVRAGTVGGGLPTISAINRTGVPTISAINRASHQRVRHFQHMVGVGTVSTSGLPTFPVVNQAIRQQVRHFHSLLPVGVIPQCLSPSSVLPSSSLLLYGTPSRTVMTLEYMHRKGMYKKPWKKKNSPLQGRPQLRGVVLKTLIKKPKKPNSANRKCVRLRLSTGKEVTAYVPGEGHNLQEHNIVLVQGGRLQDTPGVKLTCVRGKYDLPHVKKKTV